MSGKFGKATANASAMTIKSDSAPANTVPNPHRIKRKSQCKLAFCFFEVEVSFSD